MNIKLHYNGNITITNSGNQKNRAVLTDEERRMPKSYQLNWSKYRKISSSAAYMFDKRKNKIIFLTFTLVDNVKDTKDTNKAWSYFLNYLRKQYDLHSYLWVAEKQKRGAVHYHCLFDIPFTDYNELKRVYSNVFAKFGISVSKENSVSASKTHGSIVNNTEKAVRYITKYISKQLLDKNYTFSGRNYAFSSNINVKPVTIDRKTLDKLLITCMAVYNFEFSSLYICDMKAAKDYFRPTEALKVHEGWFDLPDSLKMPTFDKCNNFKPYIKDYGY